MTEGLVTGRTIGGRFVLERLLGEGGMGAVWSARHAITGKQVALKVLKGEGAEERRRFVREARVAAAIRHPNVTEVHDVLELEDGRPVMVMDLLEGEALSDVLDRRGAIPVEELMPMALQILAGLGAAHAVGVVHRDMKPENIFLARSPSGDVTVKVLDFGIAKLTDGADAIRHTKAMTQTGSVLGTPHYMAPEQVFGEKELDHRADLWSLGVVLHECLTGRCPIEGANIGQLFKAISQRTFRPLSECLPSLDPALTVLIDSMMASKPDDRPQSTGEVAAVIARCAGHPTPHIDEPRFHSEAPRVSRGSSTEFDKTEVLRGPLARRPVAVLALGAASLAAVGLLVWRVSADVDQSTRADASGSSSAVATAMEPATPKDPVPPLPKASESSAKLDAADAASSPGGPQRRSVAMPVRRTPSPPSMTGAAANAPGEPNIPNAPVTAEASKPPTSRGGIYEVSPY